MSVESATLIDSTRVSPSCAPTPVAAALKEPRLPPVIDDSFQKAVMLHAFPVKIR